MNRETRWVGWFALVVGWSVMTSGVASLIWWRGEGIATGSGCRARCGLALLIESATGASGGHYFLAAIQLVLGIGGAWLGSRLLRNG